MLDIRPTRSARSACSPAATSRRRCSLAGVSTRTTTLAVYVWSGFCAGLAGLVTTADILGADANNAGLWLELDAILAVVIGGTLLTGGQGLMVGTFLGVMIQALIGTYITFDGTLSSWWAKIATGALLFVFIALQQGLSVLARRARRPRRASPPQAAATGLCPPACCREGRIPPSWEAGR